jgi:EAL domain-containing protein (putative c-di-GMP-specific phosphodiesterase class I)
MAIADGIENEDQLETLRSLGYNSGQGWLFGRPTSGHETTSLLNAEPPTLNTDFEH